MLAHPPVEHDSGNDLELLTITALWRFEKKLYNIGSWVLQVPISLRTLGYGAAVFIPAGAILQMAGVGWSSSANMFVRFFVPGLIVWLALRYVSHGGKALELLSGWATYAYLVGRHVFSASGRSAGVRISSRVRVPRPS